MNFNSILIGSENPERLKDYYTKLFGNPSMDDGGYFGWQIGSGWITIGPHDQVKGKNTQPGRLIWNIENRVTIAAGMGWTGRARVAETESDVPLDAPLPQAPTSSELVIGAVQTLGYRPLPLVQVHLSRRFSLDGYASWSFDLREGQAASPAV